MFSFLICNLMRLFLYTRVLFPQDFFIHCYFLSVHFVTCKSLLIVNKLTFPNKEQDNSSNHELYHTNTMNAFLPSIVMQAPPPITL